MITRDNLIDVLTKCAAYDAARFPRMSEGILAAWMEHFSVYPRLTGPDVLEAVRIYYLAPDRRVPQPADISSIARQVRRDRFERESYDGELHSELRSICDAKAADEEALADGVTNLDPALVEMRRRAVGEFVASLTPHPPAEHCRFCGVVLRREAAGLFVHPDGQPRCPQAPVMASPCAQVTSDGSAPDNHLDGATDDD